MKDSVRLLDAVGEYLEDNGIGTLGVDLFKISMPGEPKVSTVIAHTGGFDLVGDPTRRPEIQIQHRNIDPKAGLDKAVEINKLLDDKVNVLNDFPGRFTPTGGEPGPNFRDDNGHFIFPLSYQFTTTDQR